MDRRLALVPGLLLAVALLVVPAAQSSGVVPAPLFAPLGTAFTYQGELTLGGAPVNGACDVQFNLFDAPSGGNLVGANPQTVTVTVANGLFTTQLDFGGSAFTGNAGWLEMAVRCPAGSGSFALLTPRQPVTPTPNATYSSTAGNALQLGGQAASQYVLTTDPRLTDARPPTAGSANYIQNTTAQQAGANFNVSGSGTVRGVLSANQVGIGTTSPSADLGLGGQTARTVQVERNPTANSAGNALTVRGGSATAGATNQPGGELLLAPGFGTGQGGGGNLRLQTAGANDTPGTADNVLVDRVIHVAKAKPMGLSNNGLVSIVSMQLSPTQTGALWIRFMVRATDGSQVITETGMIKLLATANSVTFDLQPTDTLQLPANSVNAGAVLGFFPPGGQPGVSIFDNLMWPVASTPTIHEVYFTIYNESGAPIRLEP